MSLIRSEHLAAFAQAAASGDEAGLARLSERHPRLAGALAPLLKLAGGSQELIDTLDERYLRVAGHAKPHRHGDLGHE